MGMNYNPNDYEEMPSIEDGEYFFTVDGAEEKQFRTGSEGCALKLSVAATMDKDITVYDNLIYTSKALWKTKQFLWALGLDFDNPPEVYELVGKQGRAKFKREDKYLKVEEYLPALSNNGPDTRKQSSSPFGGGQRHSPPSSYTQDEPPPLGDEDIPF